MLPSTARALAEGVALHAPTDVLDEATRRLLKTSRHAIDSRRTMARTYRDATGETMLRRVRPLGCFRWGAAWTLATWCELRQDFHAFRVDRIETAELLEQHFADEPGRTLADLLHQLHAQSRTSNTGD